MTRPKRQWPITEDSQRLLLDAGYNLPTTTGRAVPQADRSEADWLEARRGGIGASEMASVLGVDGAYGSLFSVWWAKHLKWESQRTDAMKIGSMLEKTIGTLFAEQRPDLFVCRPAHRLWRHHDVEWLLASPDFVAVGRDGTLYPVECKSDEGTSWGAQGERAPLKHRIQLGVQCAVLGCSSGFLVRLAGKKFNVYDVPGPDAVEVDAWVMHGGSFMSSLAMGISPEPDGHKATSQALIDLYPIADLAADDPALTVTVPDELAARVRAAADRRAAALAEYETAMNLLRHEMQRAKYAEDTAGRRVASRISYKRDAYAVAACQIDQIRRA